MISPPGLPRSEFWVGIGIGGSDRSESKTPKEGKLAADKVKIDTVEIWEWGIGNGELVRKLASTEMKVENRHSYFLALLNLGMIHSL